MLETKIANILRIIRTRESYKTEVTYRIQYKWHGDAIDDPSRRTKFLLLLAITLL